MGLSTVTPKSFNSTGAQSVCRANQPKADVPIESQFLTQCGLEYINGTGNSVVRGSLGSLPLETKSESGQNVDMFYLESDVDAISGVDLTVSLTFPTIDLPETIGKLTTGLLYDASAAANTVSKDFLLSIIDHIEVRVGGLTVQRLLPEEIWQRNMTEQGFASVDNWLDSTITCKHKNTIGGNMLLEQSVSSLNAGTPQLFMVTSTACESRQLNNNQKRSPITVVAPGETVSWTISLPILGRTNDMHECFLQAGANNNSMVIAVYYKQVIPNAKYQTPSIKVVSSVDGSSSGTRGVASLLRLGRNHGFPTTGPYTAKKMMDQLSNSYNSYLTVTNHSFTNVEADFCQQNIVNKVITASQSVVREIKENEIVKPSDTVTPLNGVSQWTGTHIAEGAIFLGDQMYPGGGPAATPTPNILSPAFGFFKSVDETGGVPSAFLTNKQYTYEDKALIPITVNLDDIDINTSHLLISAFASTHRSDGSVSVSTLETVNSTCQLVDAGPPVAWTGITIGSGNPFGVGNQLCHGWSQGCGIDYDLTAMTTQTYNYSGFSRVDKESLYGPSGMEMRGVLSDYLQFIEVVIGSDRSGRIPADNLLVSSGTFGLTKNDAPIYVIPLADRPFSTAGVPMSRVGTKQVILYLDPRYAIDYGPFTQIDGNYENPSNINGNLLNETILDQDGLPSPGPTVKPIYPWAPVTKIAVTAVGTRIQTTVGGSTSFAS